MVRRSASRWALPVTLALVIAQTACQGRLSPEGNPVHGRSVAEATCAACHGANGNSAAPQIPKLAGQKASYLYAQLQAFKDGGRKSPIMSPIATGLSDTDMADVASFFARQGIQPDRVIDPALAAEGRTLYLQSISRAAPPCAMCHGGASMMPMMGGEMMGGTVAVPGLYGQHAAYLLRQLHNFATGARQSAVMSRIAVSLNPDEAKAVAEYLSGAR